MFQVGNAAILVLPLRGLLVHAFICEWNNMAVRRLDCPAAGAPGVSSPYACAALYPGRRSLQHGAVTGDDPARHRRSGESQPCQLGGGLRTTLPFGIRGPRWNCAVLDGGAFPIQGVSRQVVVRGRMPCKAIGNVHNPPTRRHASASACDQRELTHRRERSALVALTPKEQPPRKLSGKRTDLASKL